MRKQSSLEFGSVKEAAKGLPVKLDTCSPSFFSEWAHQRGDCSFQRHQSRHQFERAIGRV